VTDVPRTSTLYEAHFTPAAFNGMLSRPDRDPRPTVLPPVQCSSFTSASDELESPETVARLPSGDDDDSVPPLVRFKNRYRREQLLEEQQQRQHYYETSRDWNHNETVKTSEVKVNWSTVEGHRTADDLYYEASPPRISSDRDTVRCSADGKRSATEESRTCEKRTWSRITPEVDLPDPWVTSSKIPCCEDTLVDSRRTGADSDELLKQYWQIRHRSLDCQNGVDDCPEPKCEPISVFLSQQ